MSSVIEIIDPVDGEAILVRPYETIRLILSSFTPISIDSNLIYIESSTLTGAATYNIVIRNYLVADWTIRGRLFLGTIRIKMKPFDVNVPVYMRSIEDYPGVTAINPTNNIINFAASEILEIIVTSDLDKLRPIILDTNSSIELQHLRTESLVRDNTLKSTTGRFLGSVVSLLRVNKYHHFWFRINPASLNSIKPNEVYKLGVIKFFDDKGTYCPFEANVQTNSTEWQYQKAINQMVDSLDRDSVRMNGAYFGLEKYIDEEEGVMLNPGNSETFCFATEQKHMVVELVQPISDSCWRPEVFGKMLSVVEIEPRYVNYRRIQRFLVNNKKKMNFGEYSNKLGMVNFIDGKDNNKKIEFFVSFVKARVERKNKKGTTASWRGQSTSLPLATSVASPPARVPRVYFVVHLEERKFEDDLSYGETILTTKPPLSTSVPTTTTTNILPSPFRKERLTITNPGDGYMVDLKRGDKLQVIFDQGGWRLEGNAIGISVVTADCLSGSSTFVMEWNLQGLWSTQVKFRNGPQMRFLTVRLSK